MKLLDRIPVPQRLGQRLKDRGSKGYAEASVLVVAGSLLAGVLFGTGLTRTAVDIGDGLTWFADDPSGEVIQVNPATGRPETRIDVGDAGDDLGVAQWDGRLVVTNNTTGELTSFDMSSILMSGSRRVSPGATDVLHHDGKVFLVDRERATIAAIDPVSTDTVGQLWQSPEGIADAVVDGTGTLWVVDPKGLLSELRWSDTSGQFQVEEERTVDHSGAGSVLVAHTEGVTLFGPDSGIVVQSHTGRDDEVVASAARLAGELVGPESAPATVVPVASPATGTVVIVSEGAVHEVDVSAIGCSKPDRPEVFHSTVFVPCPGDGKVVRLTPEGQRAGDDIDVPEGGEPALVVDDGRLLINVPGADQGVVVDEDGSVSSIVRYDEDTPTAAATGSLPLDPSAVGQIAAQDTVLPPPPPSPPQSQTAPSTPTPVTPTQPSQGSSPAAPPVAVCVLAAAACPSPTATASSGGPSGSGGSSGSGNGPNLAGPGNGNGNGNGAPVVPTPPVPTAQPLAKPYDVVATPLDDGDVTLTWSYPRLAVDSFTVQEVGQAPLAKVSGSSRKATVTVPAGQHRFTVTAYRLGSTPMTSNVTDQLATAADPDAPTGLQGVVTGSAETTTGSISLAWKAADGNGTPIDDYTVVAQDALGKRTLEVDGTSAAYDVQCADVYCDAGPVTFSVVANSAAGSSDPATATLTYSGPTAPPPPANGAALVTDASHTWNSPTEGLGTTTLALNPPADWASFGGTCTWTHTGNRGGPTSGTVACGATSLEVPIDTGAIQDDSGTATVAHSIVFAAQGPTGSSQSAVFEWATTQPALCSTCPVQQPTQQPGQQPVQQPGQQPLGQPVEQQVQ